MRLRNWLDWAIVLAAAGFLVTQGAKLKGEEGMQDTGLSAKMMEDDSDARFRAAQEKEEAEWLEELQHKAALWDEHGWRAQVHLVMLTIERRGKRVNAVEDTEEVARAFVRTARELKIPLWVAVCIADVESKFDQEARGKAGERSLMQVKPFPNRPMKEITADPAFAIRWAMESLIAPKYHAEGINAALLNYNPSQAYVKWVLALREADYTCPLWSEVPE